MVKYQVSLLVKASRDLDEIYNYIVDQFKECNTAEHIVELLEDAILGLGEMPYRGALRKSGTFIQKEYRQIFVKNYTIVYRVDENKKQVVIATVRYTPSNF